MSSPLAIFALTACAALTQQDGRADGFPSWLPVFVVETDGRSLVDRTRLPGRITVLEPRPDSGARSWSLGHTGHAEISVRGNSSFYYNKKSLRLELQDEFGKDKKRALLGMPADSDWVLLASVTDRTFARNVLAHELWRRMGHPAVRWRFVELFVVSTNSRISPGLLGHASSAMRATGTEAFSDPRTVRRLLEHWSIFPPGAQQAGDSGDHPLSNLLSNSYQGLYILMERIKRGKNRVNILKLRPEHDQEPDISGGYIIKRDRLGPEERGLMTSQEFHLAYVEPKESELTPVQQQWLAKHLAELERALFSHEFRDPESGYAKYIDVDSFIDFHWLVEAASNEDGYLFSEYMHKDRGGKLKLGPIWDWDSTFGNAHFASGPITNGWRFTRAGEPDYGWYRRLFEDPDFLQRYVDRWSELRTNILATSNVLALVDRITGPLAGGQARNFRRWPVLGTLGRTHRNPGNTYQDGVDWLKEWTAGRLAWIDSQDFPKPTVERHLRDGKLVVTLTADGGRTFHTLDGADPRARGGWMSPTAQETKSPVTLGPGMVLTARVRSPYNLWSAPVRIEAPR